jgi:hypothetical protein
MNVKAEHCRSIDVRRWHREGILRPGRAGGWHWTDSETGELRASIGYRSDGDTVTLSYSIDGSPHTQCVRLSHTACTYGGARPWFICPIRGERVAVLFLRAGRFACRHCQRVAYGSQSADLIDRTWRRQAKAEARLGPHWTRPKGMHAATHDRLLSQIWECEERRDAALGAFVEAMVRRDPLLRSDPLFR